MTKLDFYVCVYLFWSLHLLLSHVRAWTTQSRFRGMKSRSYFRKPIEWRTPTSRVLRSAEDIDDGPRIIIPNSQPSDRASISASESRQLWLDLRDNAMRPEEALSYLNELLFSEEEESRQLRDLTTLVDRVLVTEERFSDLVKAERSCGLFYCTNGGELLEDSGSCQQSVLKGKVLMRSETGIFDPTITLTNHSYEWVMLDCTDDIEDVALYTDQVEGFVQIFNGACCSDASGPLGVAISCPSRDLLLSIDRFLTSQSLTSEYTQQTESGIIIASSLQPGITSTSIVSRNAIVMPFDLRLWKTALELRHLW